jgi:CHAT domain
MIGIPEGMSPSPPPSSPEEAPAPSPFASRFEELAHQGLDEAGVAGSLGPAGLLLRATFDPEGRLVWGALRNEGARLGLAGFGAGAPGDLQRLRWVAARHDFSMGLLHWMARVQNKPPLRSGARQALLAALQDLAESAEPGARVAEVSQTLSGRLREKAPSLLRLFRVLTWPLAEAGSDPVAGEELRAAERFVTGIDRQPRGRDALDAVTADYLRGVSEIWDLSSLDASLTPDTDLVVQGDDALHAVPVAWLPRGGEPLYRRVRTVRASLAPQLDALLEEIDREGTAGQGARRLLSISYFHPEDPARKGAQWLHHGHRRLADRFGAVSVAGADEKTGTVGSIRAALEQHRSFATASICGHGDFERAGILLGGGGGEEILWQGQGCDLAGIDWLLLVSCSIGRASRTGDLDVEGFCVQLAVHRARSVLACRWPVLALEAAAFANEAVRQYLELEGQPERRARALAAARRAVCEGEKPLVGLNTGAAFELYGLG